MRMPPTLSPSPSITSGGTSAPVCVTTAGLKASRDEGWETSRKYQIVDSNAGDMRTLIKFVPIPEPGFRAAARICCTITVSTPGTS
jgi:hypothetical protein